VGHLIEKNNQVKTGLRRLRRFHGAQNEAILAKNFWNIISGYEVNHLIRKFTLDISTSNNSPLHLIADHIKH